MRSGNLLFSLLVLVLVAIAPWAAKAQTSAPRLAFVVGEAHYRNAPLATATNDAGLIAQTLTMAGFDVTGAADLDEESIRRAFRGFLTRVQAAGPHAISVVYLSGYGLQYAGDNYFVPVDASLQRDTDIPVEAIRISDLTKALASLPLEARIFVLDAARANPFQIKGNPLAGGLGLVDVEEGALAAFNAAPGTVAPVEPGPYGAYARALAEMLRYGGVPVDEAFARTRLRVSSLTNGAVIPWDVSKLTRPIDLFAANPEATAPAMQNYAQLRSRPISDFSTADEAYAAAVELDTFAAYQAFLKAYPSDPLVRRVRALLAARREALTWFRTVEANRPEAYWTYMRRYPRGPHYFDARRRLGAFSVSLEPPPRFEVYDFQGLPPPPEDEYDIIDQPIVIFGGPDYPAPPPPPASFLAPPPDAFKQLPPPADGAGGLPLPATIATPYARPGRQGSFSQPDPGQPDLGQPDLGQPKEQLGLPAAPGGGAGPGRGHGMGGEAGSGGGGSHAPPAGQPQASAPPSPRAQPAAPVAPSAQPNGVRSQAQPAQAHKDRVPAPMAPAVQPRAPRQAKPVEPPQHAGPAHAPPRPAALKSVLHPAPKPAAPHRVPAAHSSGPPHPPKPRGKPAEQH